MKLCQSLTIIICLFNTYIIATTTTTTPINRMTPIFENHKSHKGLMSKIRKELT